MNTDVLQRIRIDKAIPGMKVAKDILTDTGLILIAQNTILTENHIYKLKLYRIPFISILQPIEVKYEKKERASDISIKSIPNTETFNNFKATHATKEEEVEEKILRIGNGGRVENQELFEISEDVFSHFQSKSQLFSFLHHLQIKDDSTYAHCLNVSLLCNIFGQWLGFSEEKLKDITVAGLLHDIGKSKVDNRIITKPGKLTSEEFEEVKKHTTYGFEMLQNQNLPEEVKKAVLHHHERFDGSGYPMGVTNNELDEFSKIVAIADVYDAMTSNRSYRNKFSPFAVIRSLEQEGYGKLDTKLLMLFLQNIAYYYLGSWVRLTSGEEGEIIFIHPNHLSTPIVKVGNIMRDLKQETDIDILEII